MVISEELRQGVLEKDILTVRIMLKNSMVSDPTFREFNQMLAFAEEGLGELYDAHEGDELEADSSNWTKEYMDKQMVKLINNFSRERVNHVKKVCSYVYRDRVKNLEGKRQQEPSKATCSKKEVGIGLAVGGVITTVAGLAISKSIIVAAGVAATIVGGVIIATDK